MADLPCSLITCLQTAAPPKTGIAENFSHATCPRLGARYLVCQQTACPFQIRPKVSLTTSLGGVALDSAWLIRPSAIPSQRREANMRTPRLLLFLLSFVFL